MEIPDRVPEFANHEEAVNFWEKLTLSMICGNTFTSINPAPGACRNAAIVSIAPCEFPLNRAVVPSLGPS